MKNNTINVSDIKNSKDDACDGDVDKNDADDDDRDDDDDDEMNSGLISGNNDTCPEVDRMRNIRVSRTLSLAINVNGMMHVRIAFSCTCQPNKKAESVQKHIQRMNN